MLRQVRIDLGLKYTRLSEIRLITSLEGFERLATLTLERSDGLQKLMT